MDIRPCGLSSLQVIIALADPFRLKLGGGTKHVRNFHLQNSQYPNMMRPTHLLNSSSLKAKDLLQTQSLQDQLLETRLRIEQAKLQKREADLAREDVKYMRYEDMPPPSPEQEREFLERFEALIQNLDALGPKKGQSLQEWIIEQVGEVP